MAMKKQETVERAANFITLLFPSVGNSDDRRKQMLIDLAKDRYLLFSSGSKLDFAPFQLDLGFSAPKSSYWHWSKLPVIEARIIGQVIDQVTKKAVVDAKEELAHEFRRLLGIADVGSIQSLINEIIMLESRINTLENSD